MIKHTLFCSIVAAFTVGGSAFAVPPKPALRKQAAPPPKSAAAPAKKNLPPKALKPGPMWAVAYAPDGLTLAVGGYRRVFLYDSSTGAKKAEYAVSADAVRSLAFSADGRMLAAATGIPGQSGSVVVLEAATGKTLWVIKNHADTVEAVAFSGDTLLAAADDEKVSVTDVGSGKAIGALAEHIGRCLSVAVPPETREADGGGGGDIWATGGADSAVKIWDAKARRVVVNFDQCQGGVWCLASGKQPGVFIAGSGDGKIRLFRVRADGDPKRALAAGEPAPRTGSLLRAFENAHEGAVYAVSAAPDGKRIVSGGADRRVNIWSLDGGRLKQFSDAQGDIWGVAVSPDSKRLAAASLDGHTRVYDMDTGALVFTVNEKGAILPLTPPAGGSASPAPAAAPPQQPKKMVSVQVQKGINAGVPAACLPADSPFAKK